MIIGKGENMKRLNLTEKIRLMALSDDPLNTVVKTIVKFIGENYRRRVYKTSTYKMGGNLKLKIVKKLFATQKGH
jgi:hypothetical protein